jgi:hypothetical protein
MKKLVLIVALGLVATPAFACCQIPSPDMGAFFQNYDHDPMRGEREIMRNWNQNVPQYRQPQTCNSVPNGIGGWVTRCD